MLCGQKCLKTTHLVVKSVGLGIRLLALEALTSCFMQIYSFFPLASVLWSVKWRQCTVSLRMRLWVLTDDCFVDKSLSCVWLFATPWTIAHQAPLSSTISWSLLNSRPLSQCCCLTISSSATLFFCFQSFPASGSFPMSWLFTSGGQSIGASASASVFPKNILDWFP